MIPIDTNNQFLAVDLFFIVRCLSYGMFCCYSLEFRIVGNPLSKPEIAT